MVTIFSIHPKWVQKILTCEKTVEFRRRHIKQLYAGDTMFIYETQPTKAITCIARVKRTVAATPEEFLHDDRYKRFVERACLTPEEFRTYAYDAKQMTAIIIKAEFRVHGMTLEKIRGHIPKWRPPYSWQRCNAEESTAFSIIAGCDDNVKEEELQCAGS